MSGDQPNRLDGLGRIDRAQPLSFRFDGKAFSGYAGDTLASALLASGARLVGRSFKYHRPRGILTDGSAEPNALVELRSGARREPNTRATVAELFDGLEARSQNRWPSLGLDVGSINSLLSPLFVAGFYYKTFMWPAAFWEKLYEPLIRRAAGLGRASMEPDPDSYEKAFGFCDLMVIGAGPAGLAAALAAGRAGARVVLADEDFQLGGRLLAERHEIDGMQATDWVKRVEAELASLPEVRVMRRTTVHGVYDGCTYGLIERVADHLPVPPPHQPRQRLWRVVAKRALLAAGATERPIVFGGNDRPGVMLASAARGYVNRFGVTPGQRVSVFTSGDDGWRTAIDLAAAGVTVTALIDARVEVSGGLSSAAKRLGFPVMLGTQVIGTSGTLGLRNVIARGGDGATTKLAVDCLAMAGGWNPNFALSTHLGGRPSWSDAIAAFVPGAPPPGMRVIGAAQGVMTLAGALKHGAQAGADVASELGFSPSAATPPRADDEPAGLTPLWRVADSKGKSFIDFQHDVTPDDVELASREGYRSVELLKRYTTLGMATDQGKTSNVNGLAIMAALTDRTIPEVGVTVARPPYTPVAIGALAGPHRGKHFKATRLTAGHGWAASRGAVFIESGQWLRAQWFPKPGESDWLASVTREVRETRASVGMCDVSTLGKIDVQGSGAAAFLDRVYANTPSAIKIGMCGYGLMLREDGFVLDDGVAARFAADHYVISTTTANAVRVMQHLEHARQVLWPELDVQLISVTEQWAQYAIAGPNSRKTLERLLGDAIDVSNEAFPFMACVEFTWRGVPARLYRVSFSGELAYEFAVPARYGDATARAIMTAGAPFAITPYGLEAIGVMRIEKGHVAGGELNGTTTAGDLGLGRMVSKKKDCIGKVLSARPGLTDPERAAVVGVKPVDRAQRVRAGGHLVRLTENATLENDQGYVTSVAFSPMLEHWLGLALLKGGRARLGERMRFHDPLRGPDLEVEICDPVFFDPKGARLHG